jgi:hypothetical protein
MRNRVMAVKRPAELVNLVTRGCLNPLSMPAGVAGRVRSAPLSRRSSPIRERDGLRQQVADLTTAIRLSRTLRDVRFVSRRGCRTRLVDNGVRQKSPRQIAPA